MNLSLDNTVVFVAIADNRNISAAARQLGLPKSTVSRRLKELESTLGMTLFNRSTRAMSLTDDGVKYYEKAKPLFDAAIRLEDTIQQTTQPTGLIRITATAAVAQYMLFPVIQRFLDLNSDIRIELHATDRRINLIENGIDIAIRLGPLEDSELILRKLKPIKLKVVASPALLEGVGEPTTPQDLKSLECVTVSRTFSVWRFENGENIPVNWRFSAGNMLLAHQKVLSGGGFAALPAFMLAEDIKKQRLVEVLKSFPLQLIDASLVTPKQQYRAPSLQKFIDYLLQNLGN
ncbi:LysR family transcriptional regulator [Alteromonas australica]|uniref:LysR family transcriptional regulator n=1 Tax=Alteromonas australica TaxID=589873 RepID=UPI0035C80649